MAKDSCDIAVVGHFSLDSIILPSQPKPCKVLGGAVAFVSLVARVIDVSVSVISRVGSDFPKAYISQFELAAVDISGIVKAREEQTTSFELTYSKDLSSRELRLLKRGVAIDSGDLPRSFRAKTIHIAPIAAEISYDTVERLRGCCDCLSIDPQGMTRIFDVDGAVSSGCPVDKQVLGLVDVYKSSLDEIQVLTGHSDLRKAIGAVHDLGPETVIATMGSEGSVLSLSGDIYTVPACKSARVVDPTGAGDVFIGAYLAERIRKPDPFWCSCVGSAAASLKVEGIGSSFFGDQAEIYRRAMAVYQKEIKP